jgi:hypothetical protein
LKEDDVEAIPSDRRFGAGASLLDIRNRLRRGPQQNRRRRAMKGFVTILALILAVGLTAPNPKSQSACEKAGMKWDSTASAPKLKCNSAFA